MSEMIKALKEVYDVEDCKYILEGGCVSGTAHSHIYYSLTDEELCEYLLNPTLCEGLIYTERNYD